MNAHECSSTEVRGILPIGLAIGIGLGVLLLA